MDVAKLYMNNDYSEDHEQEDDEMMKEAEEVVLPGFRLHPTDEELVAFYLRSKVEKKPLKIEPMKHVDIYKCDSWDHPRSRTSPWWPRIFPSILYEDESINILFNFFCDKARTTPSRKEIIGELLRAKQSGNYTEDACQAFSDWFIFSPKPQPRPKMIIFSTPSMYDGDYDLLKDQFKTLVKSNYFDFERLCLHLYSWYMGYERSSSKISIRSMNGDILPLDESVATAESGVLKGYADSIQEGLVVDGDDGVIPVPNVSTYVLSQVIHFLEKKQHFQENIHKAAAHYEAWSTAFFNRNTPILSDLKQVSSLLIFSHSHSVRCS